MPSLSTFFPAAPAAGRPGDPGLFGPGSAAWRVGRERALLAGGPAALLLQVAHPLVAAGVAAHSDFGSDPLRRLRGTLDAVLTVVFGDTDQVRAAAEHVSRRHRPVRGALVEQVGDLPAGTPYRAEDPDLALWVFATLVWSAVRVVDGFVRPVGAAERDAYYRDMTRTAPLFRVRPDDLPEDHHALERYVAEQVAGTLVVDATARALAAQVLTPTPPLVPAPLRPVPALLAAGVLPPPVRDAYGLPWRRRERAAFAAARHASRLVVPVLPDRLRTWPHHAVAVDRLRATS
ncbi:oxygenase MpaB family protein [Cellulomonas endophytica]|uniref:oxygenase MpaB family protein n=1 Tax=Cellulomonas endophytica TaxID=2494735 RepID=UPI0013E92B88|nr:oxygenase MpaB family protein [Cellulomonas endophytica]